MRRIYRVVYLSSNGLMQVHQGSLMQCRMYLATIAGFGVYKILFGAKEVK